MFFNWRVLVTVAVLSLSQAAHGANVERYRVLGFAKKGDIFVFETYTNFDGSGGGHSSYYALDTKADKWINGTPIRYVVSEGHAELDNLSLADIRMRAQKRALKFLSSVGYLNPGVPLVVRALGDYGSSAKRIKFGFPMMQTANGQQWSKHELSLETIKLDNPNKQSREYNPKCKGMLLLLNEKVIYEDINLPKSRACAKDYQIVEVRWQASTDLCVIIVGVLSQGFEGVERDIIAIPVKVKWRR